MVFHWTSVRAAGTVLSCCSYTHSQGSDVPMNSLCFFRTPVALRRSRQVGGMGGSGGGGGGGCDGGGGGAAGGDGGGGQGGGGNIGIGGEPGGDGEDGGVVGGEGGLSHTLTDTVAPPLSVIVCSIPGTSDSTVHPEFSTVGLPRGKSSRTSKHTGTTGEAAT